MNERYFMLEAIREAKKYNYKFGAVVAKGDNKIIASAGRVKKNDARFHAESQAILKAGKDLRGCTLFATAEPCAMCFYLAWTTNISRIVFGATIDDEIQVLGSEINIATKELNERGGNRIKLRENFMRKECLDLLKEGEI